MTHQKRIFDLIIAAALCIVLLPVLVGLAILVLLFDGRPILYLSERMKTPKEGFSLVKFRTMLPAEDDDGASGGHKRSRITSLGRTLRKTRLDELPQLINVLAGDISFVGPRPPLRVFVERFPNTYDQVLRNRPGITGIASVYYHNHEEFVLGKTRTAQETEEVYCRVCIPRKAHLDLIYQNHQSVCFDIKIMLQTVFSFLR